MSSFQESLFLSGRKVLTVNETKDILSKYGLPFNKSIFVSKHQDLSIATANLSFPVVMKIISPQIIHKTDVGGVILHLNSTTEVLTAYNTLMNSLTNRFPHYDLQGVVLEEEVPAGIELIAGVVNDPTFGHCLMFGLGGIFVEVIQDVSFRLIPASREDISSMLSELKFSKILLGARGQSIDTTKLIDVLFKLSTFVKEHSEVVSEIDLNPIIATKNDIVIVDARIILKG